MGQENPQDVDAGGHGGEVEAAGGRGKPLAAWKKEK